MGVEAAARGRRVRVRASVGGRVCVWARRRTRAHTRTRPPTLARTLTLRPRAAASTPNNYLAIPGGGQFDVVHANWGLHDLVAACEPGQSGECEEHVDISNGDYGNNLVALYQRFEPVAKQFIWVSTTPVPNVTTSMGRSYELAVAYNKQALDYLSTFVSGNLVVDDLWAAFVASCGAYYKSCALQQPANVHLTKAGEAFAAQHAFASIQAAIARLEARGE